MTVGAKSLLLILLGDGCFVGSVVHAAALRGVELVGHPGFAIVHAFVYGQGLGSRRTKLQAHVGNLKFFTQRKGESHVVRRGVQILRLPTGEVVGRVEVSEVGSRVGTARVGRVADLARAYRRTLIAPLHHTTGPGGRSATHAGHNHLLAEGGVDKLGDAPAGCACVIVAGVRRGLLPCERIDGTVREGRACQEAQAQQVPPRFPHPAQGGLCLNVCAHSSKDEALCVRAQACKLSVCVAGLMCQCVCV